MAEQTFPFLQPFNMPIDNSKREKILKAIGLGMPLESAAYFVDLEPSIVQDEIDRDASFLHKVNKATADCMHALLEKLEKLDNWQAVAFLLVSIWPHRFGRKARNTRRKGAKRRRSRQRPNFDVLPEREKRLFDKLLAKVHGRQPITVTVRRRDNKRLPAPR